MGGPYNIPRNYKGESKILFVFSTKALIYTCIGAGIGLVFFYICKLLGFSLVGMIFVLIFGLIGFSIGTFKIPDNKKFEFMRKNGGENIDSVILKWIKFKQKHNRIYVYKKEDNSDAK